MHAKSLFAGAAVTAALSATAVASTPSIPDAVQQAVARLFDGRKAQIEAEGRGRYEAGLRTTIEVTLDSTGRIEHLEVEIPLGLAPRAVRNTAKATLPSAAKIEEAEIVIRDGKLLYEIEAQSGRDEIALLFDPGGRLVSEETESEGAEGEDDDDDDDDNDD